MYFISHLGQLKRSAMNENQTKHMSIKVFLQNCRIILGGMGRSKTKKLEKYFDNIVPRSFRAVCDCRNPNKNWKKYILLHSFLLLFIGGLCCFSVLQLVKGKFPIQTWIIKSLPSLLTLLNMFG